ncbi:LytTR family DNA-binding domain-containing protein [Oerskovia paurometabola]|uniref:LytTR family transcriptional regulator DNA-binding domain-containing protein n=1 Tax=Oerskovia paurometabola TaxID=162170 RepID=A0ABW1XFS5_9CELL|nr:LytTR family DNA-binding domain-containing protein [Oerskovia paurometabola]MBM7497540.1 two-component system response regulator LytT [Oerskovia paurometabola]
MVQLVCSPAVGERLRRELAAVGIPADGDGWALVERGFDVPTGRPAVIFDPLDHVEVVRTLAPGLRDAATGPPRMLTGQSGTSFTVIAPREVRYFEAAAEGIVACTATGRYRVRETLAHYESAWAGLGFLRVNKSQLANLLHVTEIVPWFNSRYVLRLTGGTELEVSKTYAKRLRSALKM